MDAQTYDVYVVVDLFLLLLIGIGPKIALVPFLKATGDMDGATRASVTRKMLSTAAAVAAVLVVFGGLLTKLLHFSPAALSIAGGIILLIIAVDMVRGSSDEETERRPAVVRDPLQLAVYPLAVPYLLNPAGIVALVTASGDAGSVGHLAIVAALLAIVLAIDVIVFRWVNHVGGSLDESKMLVTEKVFGVLLAALAAQLILNGLDDAGVIHLSPH
jgi:MarC family membrane protein